MKIIQLPVRSHPALPEPGQPSDERHMRLYETIFPLPVEQTAFILDDVRTAHPNQGWLKRADAVVRESIVPALEAARRVGMMIIHAPNSPIAEKYPQCVYYPDTVPPPPPEAYLTRKGREAAAASTPSQWPPAEFRLRRGPYEVFAKEEEKRWEDILASYIPQSEIHSLTLPRDGEFVVPGDGATLRRLLADHKILHLIYVGFAANMCIQFKQYGMRDQARHGYNCILLRDCTNASESSDTIDGELLLKAAIREIEYAVGWTATGKDFIAACRSATA